MGSEGVSAVASRDDDLIDTAVFYLGVVLAILGIASAGCAILKAILFK